jgi:hypothetical protein
MNASASFYTSIDRFDVDFYDSCAVQITLETEKATSAGDLMWQLNKFIKAIKSPLPRKNVLGYSFDSRATF